MKNLINATLLCGTVLFSVNQEALARGSKAPKEDQPEKGQPVIDFAMGLAIVYAKTDPRYASLLTTLGINNADDLKSFLQGNQNGLNFQSILARLAFLEAQSNPKAKKILADLGIQTEADLRNYLKNGTQGIGFDSILDIALKQALSNSKYTVWLKRLNIQDIEDFKKLIKGNGEDGNLLSLVAVVALYYVESNPEYAEYAVYIRLLMAAYGIVPGSDGTGDDQTSDDDIIDLGAFGGMTVGEVKAVRKLK